MTKKDWGIVLLLLLFVSVVSFGATNDKTRLEATAGVEPEAHKHFSDDWAWMDSFHNPAPNVQQGLDLRLREVYGPRIDTLDHSPPGTRDEKWHFQRYRMRYFTKLIFGEDAEINSRLVWEFRTWQHPDRKDQNMEWDEVLFDRLNLTMRNAFDMPLTLVVGRQDIIMGRGWLVLDGTPLDGSRTIFFDAVRGTFDIEDKDMQLDLIYINNKADASDRLKPINDQEKELTEQDEQGVIIELRDNARGLAGYFIYKKDNDIVSEDSSFPSSAWSKDAEIYTFGGRSTQKHNENWSSYLEAAAQFGKKNYEDLCAYGLNSRLTYSFNDEKSSAAHIGYEFLSGDDPSTDDIEAFDPLWGEWPQWSELYIYTYSRETMIGETTNLHRLNFGYDFKPCPRWQVLADYHLLWANQGGQTDGSTFYFSDTGNFRGQLFTLWLKWSCCKRVRAHYLVEYFVPGNFYDQSNRSSAWFLRANLEYTF